MSDTTVIDTVEGAAAPEADLPTVDQITQAETPPETAAEEPRDPRQRIMKTVTNRISESERQASRSDKEPQPETAAEAAPAAGSTPEASAEPAPTTETESETPAAEPRKFTLKVNGVEREVTEEEMIAAAQKQFAGVDLLSKAAALRKGGEPPASTPQPTGAKPESESAPSPSSQEKIDPDTRKKWAEHLVNGDVDEVDGILEKLFATGEATPQMSDEDIREKVRTEAMWLRIEEDDRTARAEVAKDFEDVAKDPNLYGIARNIATREVCMDLLGLGYTVEQLQATLQTNPMVVWQRHAEARMRPDIPVRMRPYQEIYRVAAEETRKAYGRPTEQPSPTPSDTLQQRKDAKAGAPQPPRSANVTAAMPPPEPKGPKAAARDVLRMRGQAS